jgi:hypothetical protein
MVAYKCSARDAGGREGAEQGDSRRGVDGVTD